MNAANTLNNIVNNSGFAGETSGFSKYLTSWPLVVVAILILLVTGAALVWTQWSTSPWWADKYNALAHVWDWLGVRNTSIGLRPSGALQEIPAAMQQPAAPPVPSKPTQPVRETWCFVGEDFTGRWCVKVPSPESCSSERAFASRETCQLVEASHMPGGIVKNGGANMDPLRNLTII